MKYFLIAGEASGDLHASNLMRALKKIDPQSDFRFLGGDQMQSVGGTLVGHYRDLAFMGFIPVLTHLYTIVARLNACKRSIKAYQPDVVILVDYPGFNLKIAEYVKRQLHLPVYYYISPKIWAWKEYRIRKIKKYVDRMLCILPFEADFYRKHDYPVVYVGNPTMDALARRDRKAESFEEFIQLNNLENKPVIALLAGSRKQEIKDNLPAMLEAAGAFGEYQPVVAGAPGIDPSFYGKFTRQQNVRVVSGQTYRLLQQAKAALVTSGTATLETALLRVPQAVCYKVPFKHLSSFVFEKFFSCKYISLVNLIAGKTVVRELFGKDFTVQQIRDELDLLLHDEKYRKKMTEGYREVTKKLGTTGASKKAAQCAFLD
ncbi:MAG: lipid-A-disaccharide synthase [Dysgonamonadaceae bacterium]|jgi:lipid-A-disaccharide synthase|nr:lipid-A-disaccharide synthase [Dysgonamonadaceae bacterium]